MEFSNTETAKINHEDITKNSNFGFVSIKPEDFLVIYDIG